MPEQATTTPRTGIAQLPVYLNLGSSLYATTGSDPMTSCSWSAQVEPGPLEPASITVTCTFGGPTPATSVTASIPWNSTGTVPLSSSNWGVTVDGTVSAVYGVGDCAIITFNGSVIQGDVVSIGCSGGAIVAACITS